MFENVRADLRRAFDDPMRQGPLELIRVLTHPGTQAVLAYRFAHWCRTQPLVVRLLLKPLVWLWRKIITDIYKIMIPTDARIGPGLTIHNWLGGISLPNCKIGRDLTVVGGGVLWDYDTEEIGDEVWVGAGMKAVGRIRVGDRVRIGPNAVIIKDVPDDSVVFGNPARIMPGAAKWAPRQGKRKR